VCIACATAGGCATAGARGQHLSATRNIVSPLKHPAAVDKDEVPVDLLDAALPSSALCGHIPALESMRRILDMMDLVLPHPQRLRNREELLMEEGSRIAHQLLEEPGALPTSFSDDSSVTDACRTFLGWFSRMLIILPPASIRRILLCILQDRNIASALPQVDLLGAAAWDDHRVEVEHHNMREFLRRPDFVGFDASHRNRIREAMIRQFQSALPQGAPMA